jgi:hypothetical protein
MIQVAIENPVADDVTSVQMRKDAKGHLAGIAPILLLLHHNQSDHLRPSGKSFPSDWLGEETSFASLVDFGEECLKDLLFQPFAFIHRSDHLLDLADSALFVVLVNILEV